MQVVIDYENYGVKTCFDTLDEAERQLRSLGPEFASIRLHVRMDGSIVNESNVAVGVMLDWASLNSR